MKINVVHPDDWPFVRMIGTVLIMFGCFLTILMLTMPILLRLGYEIERLTR